MRRNLVIVRAGDGSVHQGWLKGPQRSFDLIVSYYGDDPHRFKDDDAVRIDQKGGKFEGLHGLFTSQPNLFKVYDYILLADDDIVTDGETFDRLFNAMVEHDFLVAQPSLSWDSYFAFPVTLRFPGSQLRYSNLVEAMAACFRADYLARLWPIFRDIRIGWGLGLLWTRATPEPRGRAAIVDSCVVRHSRQLFSGALYRTPGNPMAEREALLRHFGLSSTPIFGAYGGISETSEPMAMTPDLVERVAREIWIKLPPAVIARWPRRRFLTEFVEQHRETVDLTPVREAAP